MADRLLRERHPEVLERLEFCPFWEPTARTEARLKELGGEMLYTPMSRDKHLYILQDVKRLARSLGYGHTWPIDDQPCWELPNLVYLRAEERGLGAPFRTRVYRARWEEGQNVHDPAILERLAQESGLAPSEVAGVREDPGLLERAARALLRCHEEGVFGVPFFIKGFDKFWGVDRLGAFLAALDGRPFDFFPGSGSSPTTSPEMPAGADGYREDCAGGCG